MGAMENAGAVTITEVYVFRTKVTEAIVERRALTMLHELAHMWFGNLVTMKWWNDLWLNESFAEWASTTCQAEATEWTDAWTTFGTSEKAWAYRQDQLSSTHPIVADIRDLEDVEVNFDGITYAKGASVLKQLVAYVGREPFRDGLRAYFAKHAWGNTTLARPARASSRTPPAATCAPGRSCGSRPPGSTPCARSSRSTTGAASPRPPSSRPAPPSSRRCARTASPSGCMPSRDGRAGAHRPPRARRRRGRAPTVPELVGREQPDLLLVNDDDLAYAKIRLDERSLATALAHPRGFADSLPRSLVLGAPWDMTRDAEMGARDFVDVVLETLPGETDSTLLRTLVGQLQTARALYTAPEHRADDRSPTRDGSGTLAEPPSPAATPSSSCVSANAALTSAAGDDTATLRALLDGTEVLDGLTVDTEMRWTLLNALAAARRRRRDEIEAELAPRRHGDRPRARRPGPRRAARPRGQGQAWAAAVEESGLPNAVVEAVARASPARAPRPPARALRREYHAMLDAVERRGSHAMVEPRRRLLPAPARRRRAARRHPGLARRQPARPGGPAPPRRGEPRPGGARPAAQAARRP